MELDLVPVLKALLTSVPVWAIVGFGVRYWIKKSEEAADELKFRLEIIEKHIDAIRLTLAARDFEGLQDHVNEIDKRVISVETDMKSFFILLKPGLKKI